MHIPREIRKKLESSLPSYVLDFLTEKFIEAEKYCQKSETLEQENAFLHQQVHKMLTNFMQQQTQSQPMGYTQHSGMNYGPSNHYKPYEWEEYDFPHYGFSMRRGVPGTGRGSRSEMRRSRSEITSQGQGGQGGGQGGQGQGGGGSQGAGTTSSYVPDIERPYRRHSPMYEQNFLHENREEIGTQDDPLTVIP